MFSAPWIFSQTRKGADFRPVLRRLQGAISDNDTTAGATPFPAPPPAGGLGRASAGTAPLRLRRRAAPLHVECSRSSELPESRAVWHACAAAPPPHPSPASPDPAAPARSRLCVHGI